MLLAALALLLAASFPFFSRFLNANERPRLLQGIAWVEEGSCAIDGPVSGRIAPGIDVSRAPPQTGGRLYPNKPPGATVPAALAYGVLRTLYGSGADDPPPMAHYTWLARMLGGWLPSVLLLWFVWTRLVARFGVVPSRVALVVYALATPVVSYARLLFGHQLAACLLLIGAFWVVEGLDSDHRGRALAGGLLAGCAVPVEYLTAFAGLPLAVIVVRAWLRGRRQAPLMAAFGALVPISALAAYHHYIFGSVFATPYHFVVRADFAQTHSAGLLGLNFPTSHTLFEHLVSPWGGLLYWAPCLVLALGVAVMAWRRGELSGWEKLCLAIFSLMLVLNLGLSQSGGWRVGPRYLVCAFPFMLPALARVAMELGRNTWLYVLFAAALGWSVVVNALAGNLFPHLIPEGNPLADVLVPLVVEGRDPYNLLGLVGLGAGAVALYVAASVLAAAYCLRPRVFQQPAIRGVMAVLLALILVLLAGSPTLEPSANFTAIVQIWEP